MTMKKEITLTPIFVADLLVAEDERMPVYVHIIDHPDGRVLVDTGMTLANWTARNPMRFTRREPSTVKKGLCTNCVSRAHAASCSGA